MGSVRKSRITPLLDLSLQWNSKKRWSSIGRGFWGSRKRVGATVKSRQGGLGNDKVCKVLHVLMNVSLKRSGFVLRSLHLKKTFIDHVIY